MDSKRRRLAPTQVAVGEEVGPSYAAASSSSSGATVLVYNGEGAGYRSARTALESVRKHLEPDSAEASVACKHACNMRCA